MSNISIWPINRSLAGAPIPGRTGSGSEGNKGALCILQISSITGASPLDGLESYTGHSLVGVLSICRDAAGVFNSPSEVGSS